MSKRISTENIGKAHFFPRKEGKNAVGNDAEVYCHRGNKVKTLASTYKDIGEPLGACLGPDFRKKYGVPKMAFPFSFPFQNGQFWPSCGQLVFLGGNERPRFRFFLRKQGKNVFCNDAGMNFYGENKVKTQSAAMSKRISTEETL